MHRAAKRGKLCEIPKHLLRIDLFLVKNFDQQNVAHRTPLHVAAMYGHLNQVQTEFLTTETLSVFDKYGRTPLHELAGAGHAASISWRVFPPELLKIPDLMYGNTIFHFLAWRNQLSLLPLELSTSETTALENHDGETPQQITENLAVYHEWHIASGREAATKQQKKKLGAVGIICRNELNKKQASKLLTDFALTQLPQIKSGESLTYAST